MGVRGRPLEFLRTSSLAKNESSDLEDDEEVEGDDSSPSTSSSSSRFLKTLGFLVAEGVISETFFLFLLRHRKVFKSNQIIMQIIHIMQIMHVVYIMQITSKF